MTPRIFTDHIDAWYDTKIIETAIGSSSKCGCIHCLKIFAAKKISDWIDDEQTALCPKCELIQD